MDEFDINAVVARIQEEYAGLHEASVTLGVSDMTLRNLVKNDKLPHVTLFGRIIIAKAALDAYLGADTGTKMTPEERRVAREAAKAEKAAAREAEKAVKAVAKAEKAAATAQRKALRNEASSKKKELADKIAELKRQMGLAQTAAQEAAQAPTASAADLIE
jgi:excisionase family DNA binding protein